jgi:hypothetical protein
MWHETPFRKQSSHQARKIVRKVLPHCRGASPGAGTGYGLRPFLPLSAPGCGRMVRSGQSRVRSAPSSPCSAYGLRVALGGPLTALPLLSAAQGNRSLPKSNKIRPIPFTDTIPYPTSFLSQGFSRIRIRAIKSPMKSNRNEDFQCARRSPEFAG